MYLERLEIAKENKGESNCHGFSLYVTGVIDTDRFVDPDKEDYFSKMKLLDKPEVCSLALFKGKLGASSFSKRDDEEIDVHIHTGVVTSVDPLLMIHRPKHQTELCGLYEVEENVSVKEYFDNNRFLTKYGGWVEYRMPVEE